MLISLGVGNSQGIIKHFVIIRVKIMRTCSFGIRWFLICWWLNLHTTSSFENRVEVQHCLFVFLFQSKMLVCLQRKRIKKWECNERNNLKRKKVCTLKQKLFWEMASAGSVTCVCIFSILVFEFEKKNYLFSLYVQRSTLNCGKTS